MRCRQNHGKNADGLLFPSEELPLLYSPVGSLMSSHLPGAAGGSNEEGYAPSKSAVLLHLTGPAAGLNAAAVSEHPEEAEFTSKP
jgi:hypothetical protein